MPSPADTWPITIVQDRYSGVYSGGRWLAIAAADRLENGCYRIVRCLENGPFGDDVEARSFWENPPNWIAVGDSPDAALHALEVRLAAAAPA
jgi:hypothetical protein